MSKQNRKPFEDTVARARRLMSSAGLSKDEAAQLCADRDQVNARARLARRLAEQMRAQADEFVRTATELETIARDLAETAERWDGDSRPAS